MECIVLNIKLSQITSKNKQSYNNSLKQELTFKIQMNRTLKILLTNKTFPNAKISGELIINQLKFGSSTIQFHSSTILRS